MTIITPDTSPRLKPDFFEVVQTIYKDMCNLQRGEQVLVITDARTPDHISGTFHGVARALGAEVITIDAGIPAGGPSYQPSTTWPPTLAAAAKEADLIIDLVVGYAPFINEAIANGARVMCPADGISGPFTDEMLIRTIRDVDIHAVRKNALAVADRFTQASTCELITGDGDRLEVDIRDLAGGAHDGYMWDREKQKFVSNYAGLPPAQPGVIVPRGRTNGTMTVDGTVLWHNAYHERPSSPLKFTFENGKLLSIAGDKYLRNRLRHWLESLGDSAWEGVNHVNLGINPNALLTQSQEFERVMGSVTCGMGDFSLGGGLYTPSCSGLAHTKAKVHWDLTIMQPTVLLDGRPLLKEGALLLDA